MTPFGSLLARRLAALRQQPDSSPLSLRSPFKSDIGVARRLRFQQGTIADYRELARFHYRAGDPAPGSRVWTLRDPHQGGELVGVLVASRPVLNAGWRGLAWPGRFNSGNRRADALRINRELRVISRVVIDPRWRASGLGVHLVRRYLERPLTRFTEAVAAMADLCPFFERAGMTRVPVPPGRRERKLRIFLEQLNLPPHGLCAPWAIPRSLRRRLAPAVRAWARDSRATSRLAHGRLNELLPLAAAGLVTPWAFVHDRLAPPPAPTPRHVPPTPSRNAP